MFFSDFVLSSILFFVAEIDPSSVGSCRAVCKQWRDVEDIEFLLKKAYNPNEALTRSAKSHNVDLFERLFTFEYGIDPQNLLEVAARAGNYPLCSLISNIDYWTTKLDVVDANFPDVDAAFSCAASSGHIQICYFFMNALKSPYITFQHAISLAADNGHVNACMKLVNRACLTNVTSVFFIFSKIMTTFVRSENMNAIEQVTACAKRFNIPIAPSKYLVVASETGNKELCQYFCNKGAMPTNVALRNVAKAGSLEAVEYLCYRKQFGGRAAKPAANNSSALLIAAKAGHAAVCARLVELGAKPGAYNNRALAAAAERGHLSTCATLLRLGANAKDVELMKQDVYELLMNARSSDRMQE